MVRAVTNAIKVILDEMDNKKLEAPNNAPSESNSLNKSTYASWIRHFDIGSSEIELEAMLLYRL